MIRSESPVSVVAVRVVGPIAAVVGTYLLFAGHNRPGGGFAAGLVFGAVLALRTVTGLRRPCGPGPLISAGVLLVAAVAAAPVGWGAEPLDQLVVSAELPLLGTVKSGSALVFDIGVAAIVIGLVLAVLDGLGASELAGGTSATPAPGEAGEAEVSP